MNIKADMSARGSTTAGVGASEPIAIVGMACIYPGAPDLGQYWRNILGKVDAVRDAPDDWCGELFYDPDSTANDRIYTQRGGFLGDLARFDPLRHGVMPSSVDGGEPDQFLALEVAADAVADAEFDQRPVDGDRVSVILGRGTYINRGFATVVQHGVMVERFLAILRQLNPDTTEPEIAELKAKLKESLPPFNAEMAPALVPNLVTGRIANRLDFRGANYIIDAACASSLIALDRGVSDLRAGRCDLALVGGVHASTPPPIYQIFCQLEALSRKGNIRPFSKEADGTLLAEGIGILCIKRLSDAEAASDRIYAVVRSVGVASDGRGLGMLAPRVEGETRAIRRAYEEADVDPGSVGLIEAHGTATTLGDATEVEALSSIFGKGDGQCALGSVKSMIGHCLPAAGSAGLIKAAMALHHKVLPPTLIDTPNDKLGLDETGFYLNTETRPWIHGRDTPRRAGVNAFGFGGINAHALLEEYTGGHRPAPMTARPTELLALDATTPEDMRQGLGQVRQRLADCSDLGALAREVTGALGQGPVRVAVVAASPAEALENITRIEEALKGGKARLRDRRGAYLATEPLAVEGKIAFAFPGEGSQHRDMLSDLMLHFPIMRQWFDIADGACADPERGLSVSEVIFPPPLTDKGPDGMWQMDVGPEAIFAANQAVLALYEQIGLTPDMLIGHSTGEYSALYAAGVTRRDSAEALQEEIRALNAVYKKAEAAGEIATGTLLAVAAVDNAVLLERVKGRDDVFVAMDNCPNQQILAATSVQGRDWAEELITELGGFSEVLPFDRAYHCAAFGPFSKRLRAFLKTLEFNAPATPVYSCLTAEKMPDDPAKIRKLTADQWSGRVRFAETIDRMYAHGARIFVECGPRNNLTAFTNELLRGKPHLAIAVDTPARGGLGQLHHFAAQLLVEGVHLDLAALFAPVAEGAKPPSAAKPLKMGLQPMSLKDFRPAPKPSPASQVSAPPPDAGSPAPVHPAPVAAPPGDLDPFMASYFETMEKFVATERDIMAAYLGNTPAPATGTTQVAGRFPMLSAVVATADGSRLTAQLEISLQTAPYLADHAFGRSVSAARPDQRGLSVVPLTFSIEALAQTAAALCPDLVVTGLREVRASRWIALDRPVVRLEAEAELLERGDVTVVRVRMRDADGPALRPIIVESDVEMAVTRHAPPPAPQLRCTQPRKVDWSLDDIYGRIMFHGPRLQAVEDMHLAADDCAKGRLVGLAHDGLYAATADPVFETDAITLDAVGQLVGVWAAEMLPEGFHIFPFRVERIEIFRDRLADGERAECHCQVELIGTDEMRSDIFVIGGDGTLQCRIEGWWDKRFDLPERFFKARLDPSTKPVSRVALSGADAPGIHVTCIDDLPDTFLNGSGGIWEGVLAGLALTPDEMQSWRTLATAPDHRRYDWLRGRVAAKDAARATLASPCFPADIGIAPAAGGGAPRIATPWPADAMSPPLLSIAHSGGIACAAAADPSRYAGVGIDIEAIAPRSDAFLLTAFSPDERALLPPDSPDRERIATWIWTAKEAVAKAFGAGLDDVMSRHTVCAIDQAARRVTVRNADKGNTTDVWVDETVVDGCVVAVATRPILEKL
ncbi:beta-ketoacyl synthase N-terminal-like domain-containing protein [Sulfitobacter sp. JB4-11]|uniref:beta-ketoacyl synthase N-terminal-like domain-containing protein n=1 Tax=Sulfitobacter rhodophyticola TaxID=3238304 RepID=UPI00351121AD